MPSLDTPKARFLHLPKTGGTWVTAALASAGVPTKLIVAEGPSGRTDHASLAEAEDTDRFTFAFVRHPLDWWRSVWTHQMRYGWPDPGRIRNARSTEFATFIRRVTVLMPGHAGDTFERYVGPPTDPISFIGRYEKLAEDLVRALHLAGETFDERLLRETSAANRGSYSRFPADYDRDLALRVVEAEQLAIERFYLDDPLPESLLLGPCYRGRVAPPAAWYRAAAAIRKARPGTRRVEGPK